MSLPEKPPRRDKHMERSELDAATCNQLYQIIVRHGMSLFHLKLCDPSENTRNLSIGKLLTKVSFHTYKRRKKTRGLQVKVTATKPDTLGLSQGIEFELLIFQDLPPECWDYKHTSPRPVYILLSIEPGSSHMLGRHATN